MEIFLEVFEYIFFRKKIIYLIGALLALNGIFNNIHSVAPFDAFESQLYYADKIMHFAGGLLVAMTTDLFYLVYHYRAPQKIIRIVLIMGGIALIGVLWEMYEFLMDVFGLTSLNFGDTTQPDLFDTIGDLVSALIAGVVYIVFSLRQHQEEREL